MEHERKRRHIHHHNRLFSLRIAVEFGLHPELLFWSCSAVLLLLVAVRYLDM